MGHENDDMYEDMHMSGEFDDGQALNTGATEAIIAKHHNRQQKAAILAQRHQGNAKFLSREWFKNARPAPLNHIKNNAGKILTTTTLGTAGAALGTFTLSKALNITPDLVSVAKTAVVAYPGYRLLDDGCARLGFWYGHLKNALGRDRFHEVKTEPAGRWLGRTAWAGMAVAGGVAGHAYWDAIENVTIGAPGTIFQGAPSAFVDTFTNASNTSLDPLWELEDQASCLQQQALNENHICLDGPGSDAITVTIDAEAVKAAGGNDADLGVIGRRLGIDTTESFDWVPNIPDSKTINDWALQRLGL